MNKDELQKLTEKSVDAIIDSMARRAKAKISIAVNSGALDIESTSPTDLARCVVELSPQIGMTGSAANMLKNLKHFV